METTFSPTNSSKYDLNEEQLPQKKLLNTSRGHQEPKKADHYLLKEVGQNIKDKKNGKRVRDGDPSWGGNREGGEVSKQQEAFSQVGLWGVLESQRAT